MWQLSSASATIVASLCSRSVAGRVSQVSNSTRRIPMPCMKYNVSPPTWMSLRPSRAVTT